MNLKRLLPLAKVFGRDDNGRLIVAAYRHDPEGIAFRCPVCAELHSHGIREDTTFGHDHEKSPHCPDAHPARPVAFILREVGNPLEAGITLPPEEWAFRRRSRCTQILGHDAEGFPIVAAHRGPAGDKLFLRCPFCGEQHGHGIQKEAPFGAEDGARHPHCSRGTPNMPQDYILREVRSRKASGL